MKFRGVYWHATLVEPQAIEGGVGDMQPRWSQISQMDTKRQKGSQFLGHGAGRHRGQGAEPPFQDGPLLG